MDPGLREVRKVSAIMYDYLVVAVIGLLLCDLRWRRLWLRLMIVGILWYLLLGGMNMQAAERRALARPGRVLGLGAPHQEPVPASEFARGVIVMEAEARRQLGLTEFPLIALVWLGISPPLLDRLGALRLRLKERKRGDESRSGERE
jgi:hypothetical protein